MSFTVDDLPGVLGFHPTDEQVEAITADFTNPLLVVAGAGSGKTTLMCARAVWAVANGLVDADSVLGLTFTTKAAAELSRRMRAVLTRLAALAPTRSRPGADGEAAGDPTCLTYHSFAHRLVSEHGLRIGVEPAARLLTDAELAQFAYRVVVGSRLNLATCDSTPSRLAGQLVDLDGRMAEHSLAPSRLREEDEGTITAIGELPRSSERVAKVAAASRSRIQMSRLVEEFREAKLRAAVLDFADLMRFCDQLVGGHPQVVASLREQYRMVFLDEYQDTSAVQTRILSAAFGSGHPVTAVGDPLQGIFGWRGASAASIEAFPVEFAGRDGSAATTLTLSISQRSPASILDAANRVAGPLRARHPSAVKLRPSVPGGPQSGGDGRAASAIRVAAFDQFAEEAQWVASQIAEQISSGTTADQVAVLCRTGGDGRAVAEELGRVGVPSHLASSGALLSQPEVTEILSVLRAMHNPTDNRAAVRLLAGPRWRIGMFDLAVLGRRAADLARAGARGTRSTGDAEPAAYRASLAEAIACADEVDLPSLTEAAADLGDPQAYPFAEEARARLLEFSAELSSLRHCLGLPLPDLICEVVDRIGLEVELRLRALNAPETGGLALATVAQFRDLAARHRGLGAEGSLGGFLSWVDAAQRLGSRIDAQVPERPGSVRIMTVHKAKGLEWDVVVVPFLSRSVFPTGRAPSSWTGNYAQLPHRLRGDSDALPALEGHSAKDYERFAAAMRNHGELDERQLAYVAATRARKLLIASGHWWGPSQKLPRGPSPYLVAIREGLPESAVAAWAPEPPEGATNPCLDESGEDDAQHGAPESPRREQQQAPQAENPQQAAHLTAEDARRLQAWDEAITHLLAERLGSHESAYATMTPPSALSTSAAMSVVADPQRFAIGIRRPMPRRPSRAARHGTWFHLWVEEHYCRGTLFDDVESADAIGTPTAARDITALDELRQGFMASGYAEREPVAVELPFTIVIAGRAISGRIDAVFRTPTGWEVVDWKTGTTVDADPLQLAIYRIAWSRLKKIAPDSITGAFVFVRLSRVVTYDDLPDEDVVAERLAQAIGSEGPVWSR